MIRVQRVRGVVTKEHSGKRNQYGQKPRGGESRDNVVTPNPPSKLSLPEIIDARTLISEWERGLWGKQMQDHGKCLTFRNLYQWPENDSSLLKGGWHGQISTVGRSLWLHCREWAGGWIWKDEGWEDECGCCQVIHLRSAGDGLGWGQWDREEYRFLRQVNDGITIGEKGNWNGLSFQQ